MRRQGAGRVARAVAGLAAAGLLATMAQAQSSCEREALTRLRAHAELADGAKLGEAVYATVCQGLRKDEDGRFLIDETALPREAQAAPALGSETLTRACVMHDLDFLGRHGVRLADAYLSDEEALGLARNCGSGALFSVRWNPESDAVAVRVAYAPPAETRSARVTSGLLTDPPNALACEAHALHEANLDLGGEWKGGIYAVACQRLAAGEIRVSLGSSAGEFPVLVLPGWHRVELKRVSWIILSPDDHHDFHCKDLSATRSDAAPADADRDDVTCDDATPCRETRWDSSVCSQMHPESSCYVAVDQQRLADSARACR